MKAIIPLILIIFLSGCVTQRRCNDKFPPEQSVNIKDSTVITYDIRYYDSIIYQVVKIPKYETRDSVVIRYENGECKSDKLYLTGRYSKAVVWMQNNVLKGQLTEEGWLPIETKLRLQEKTIKELQAKTTVVKEIRDVKYIPKLVKILAWVGGICLVILLIYVIALVLVKYTKISINPFDN